MAATQWGWYYCNKCKGLFFGLQPSVLARYPFFPICPAGGHHDEPEVGQQTYALQWGDSGQGAQAGWRWCWKCEGLFFTRNPTQGVCPVDRGAHDGRASGHYVMLYDDTNHDRRFYQRGWRWCKKCQGLFYALSGSPSKCPAPPTTAAGDQHDGSGSAPYIVPMVVVIPAKKTVPPKMAVSRGGGQRKRSSRKRGRGAGRSR